MFRSKLRFQIRLDDFRKRVTDNNVTDTANTVELEETMAFYTYATKAGQLKTFRVDFFLHLPSRI